RASLADILPDRPPERRGPARDARAAHVHDAVERVLLAAPCSVRRQHPRAHRRARRLQITVPAGRARLVRPHGRDAGIRPARPDPLRHLRQADRQLHRIQRHQVMPERKNIMKKTLGATVLLGASALALTACGGGSGGEEGVVDYWLWDANQLPAYQQCAEDFNASQEDVTVKVTQTGWDDYWSKITNGMAAGTAPDVFTDHLSKYPDFVKTEQLLSLDELDADTSIYNDGLADLWVGQDGSRYGLPKDWDTVALFYNKEMVADAGLTQEDMANLDWNPDDGGSYEKVIARLTVDENGVRG